MDVSNKNDVFSMRKLVLRLLLLTVFIAVLLEIVLRLFFINPSRQLFDQELGWRYMPNSSIVHTSEGYGYHQLNEFGFNDEPLRNKHRLKSVLVMGDSFTEALEVERRDNFVSILNRLQSDYDFINSGRGAYSPSHQLVIARKFKDVIRPDQLILVLSHGDMRDLVITPTEIRKDLRGEIVYAHPQSMERFAIKDRFRVVLHNSALATYLMRRHAEFLKKVLATIKSPQRLFHSKKKAETQISDKEIRKYQASLLRYVLNKLNETAPLTVFYIPNVVYAPKGIATISDYSKKELEVINEAVKGTNVKFYNLEAVLEEDYQLSGYPSFGFHNTRLGGEGHLNTHGHAVVANFIYKLRGRSQ